MEREKRERDMTNGVKLPLITLCAGCAERMRDTYKLYEVRGTDRHGKCEWCRKPSVIVTQYEYETGRAAAERRKAAMARQPGGYEPKDTRARYRGRWREDM